MPVLPPQDSARLVEKSRYRSLEDRGCQPGSTARRSRAGASYRGDDRPAGRGPLVAYRPDPLECSDGTTTLASDEDTPRTALPETERVPIQVRAGGACPEACPDREPFLAKPSKHAVAVSHTSCQVQRREHRLVFQAQADLQIGTLLPNAVNQVSVHVLAGGPIEAKPSATARRMALFVALEAGLVLVLLGLAAAMTVSTPARHGNPDLTRPRHRPHSVRQPSHSRSDCWQNGRLGLQGLRLTAPPASYQPFLQAPKKNAHTKTPDGAKREISGMTHVRISPHYPQSNGKIERWHQSLKRECIRPGTPLSVDDARRIVAGYVDHYNNVRLQSAIGYVAPRDKLEGREKEIFVERDQKLEHAREQRRVRRHAAQGKIPRQNRDTMIK